MSSLGTPQPDAAADSGQPTSAPSFAGGGSAAPPAAPPTPTSPTDASGKPALWKGIVMGALHGLESHVVGGLKGLAMGGIPGAAIGAVSPDTADTAWQQKKALAQGKVDQQAAETQHIQMSAKFADAQAASAVASAAVNNAKAAALPQESKDAHDQIQLGLMEHLQAMGISPVAVAKDDHDSAVSALNQIGATQGTIPHLLNVEVGGQHLAYDLSALSQAPQGLVLVNQMREASGQQSLTPQQWAQTPKAAQTQALENAGKFMAPPAPKNAMEANGTYLQYKSTADAYAKKPNADPQVLAGLQSLTTKLKGIADGMSSAERKQKVDEAQDKSNIETAAMKRQDAQPWVIGATADQKKKAQLAENIAENTNQAAAILGNRKDLFGAAAGRLTSTEQMIGNDDPDISKLGTIIHNIAMANSGVHGFRSQEGVQATEKLILNNFKNGPKAVAGALRGLNNSTQTFINDARPESYKTHSKQGGALKGMEQ